MTIEQEISGTAVDVVKQAAGMLSVQLDVTSPEALEWLRSYAFVHGQLLAEAATDVVTRKVSFQVTDRER